MKKEVRSRIDIRCTQKEKERLQELASEANMTLSEWAKQKLLGRKVTVRYLDAKGKKEINEV